MLDITVRDTAANQAGELSFSLDRLDLGSFTPSDLAELIRQARMRGHRIDQHPEVRAAISQFLDEFQARAGRYSERTIEALMGAWDRFASWCVSGDRSSLPAEVATVEDYLRERAQAVHRNTLSQDRWAIGRVHRAAGCPDPTGDERLQGTFAALVRAKVTAEETIEQAAAMRESHLDQLVELWRGSQSLLQRRDLAMMVTAYETLLRAQEITRIRGRHIKMNTDGTAVLTIPITKTNHSGEPDKAHLSRQAVTLILDYLELAGRELATDAPLFGKVTKHNKPAYDGGPLSVDTVEGVFARVWASLELSRFGVPRFSGHSARVGASQDLAAAGCNTLQIMQAGRWASERMVIRYCRDILAGESAMAIRRASKA